MSLRTHIVNFKRGHAVTRSADLERRYRRLIAAIQRSGVYSIGEASACIRDAKRGLNWSGEAINHSGGTRAVIRHALAVRRYRRAIGLDWRTP